MEQPTNLSPQEKAAREDQDSREVDKTDPEEKDEIFCGGARQHYPHNRARPVFILITYIL